MRRGGVVSIVPDEETMAIDGYTPLEVECHLRQIDLSGFIESVDARPAGGISFRGFTPIGHDFIDSVRDPETWAKTKKATEAAGGWTLDLLKDLAKGLVKKQIEKHTGIEL